MVFGENLVEKRPKLMKGFDFGGRLRKDEEKNRKTLHWVSPANDVL